jgi:sec-independent protein translocase protein TatA
MGTVGVQEMVLIFIVALVLFGPKKLPELGRTIGKAITEFRRASSDLKASFEREMHNLERETEALKDQTQQQAIETAIPQPSEYDHHSYNADTSEYVYTPDPTPTDPVPDHPSTVSATEVPGAESHGTAEPAAHEHVAEAAPGVEGTVPRVEATTQHS